MTETMAPNAPAAQPDLDGKADRQNHLAMMPMIPLFFAEQTRQHTRRKMQIMVSQGHWCGGGVPFGYQAVPVADVPQAGQKTPKRLAPDQAQASAVREAFSLATEGFGLMTIRGRLAETTGRVWTASAVRRLLTNEVNRGVLRFGDWHKADAHPPLVAREVWDAAQANLERRLVRPRVSPRDNREA